MSRLSFLFIFYSVSFESSTSPRPADCSTNRQYECRLTFIPFGLAICYSISSYFLYIYCSHCQLYFDSRFWIHLQLTSKEIERRRNVITHRRTLFYVFLSSSCFAPSSCLQSSHYQPPLLCAVVFDVHIPLSRLLRMIVRCRNDRGIPLRDHWNNPTRSQRRVHRRPRCSSMRPLCIHKNHQWLPTGKNVFIFHAKLNTNNCKLTMMLGSLQMWFTNRRGPKNTLPSKPWFCRRWGTIIDKLDCISGREVFAIMPGSS